MDTIFDVRILLLAAMFLSLTSGCTDCSVKGQVYQGHSQFQYEEGCNRYRCACRCDGSWECPDIYTINLCENTPQPPSRHQHLTSSPDLPSKDVSTPLPGSADSGGQRCSMCVVNGGSHQGDSYFTYVDECTAFRNCFCYCNGSWVCSEEKATNVCSEKDPQVSSDAGRSTIRDTLLRKEQIYIKSTSSDKTDGVSSKHRKDAGGLSAAGKMLSRCLNCTAGGKIIKGNNYFELVEGCRKLSYCTCFCNGSWSCPERFVENICEVDTPKVTTKVRSVCGSCSVKGQTFPGNRYFQITDGCVEYKHCVCYCDGSWTCPEKKSISNCTRGETTEATCKHCTVQGKMYQANEHFDLTNNCTEYSHCVCQCNGSWSCDKDAVRNICDHQIEVSANTSACMTCNAYGAVFPANQYFEVKHGCVEYRNCVCHCNGSWFCPKDSTINVCDGRKGMSLKLTGIGDPEVSETRCLTCFAYGKYFKGDSNFDVVDRCMSYRKCVCRCDGSWNCNDRFAVNICSNDTLTVAHGNGLLENRTGTIHINATAGATPLIDSQCSFCDARNKVVIGNSLFELTDGCIEYKNCLCRCDGSWECPPHFAKNICDENNDTEISGANVLMACANCVAKSKIIRGGSSFQLVDGCILYKSCQCECTGKWSCSNEMVQNVCSENANVDVEACSVCQPSPGSVYSPNSWFKLTDDCVEHSCMCFCNGSWSCPADYNRWVCEDRCLSCDVDGQIVANNTQFTHKTGCLAYTCSCHCNGTWSCPGHATRDTCASTGGQDCGQCRVSGNQVYQGMTDFILQQGCLHYKCHCNCDGSYFCPGKEARNVCRGEVIGGCRTCILSGTEIHNGDTNFTLRKGCVFYNCRCNCDGSWQCPGESSRNVCLGEFPGGCRVCRISDTETYRASSIFDFRKSCINHRCKCNCDGSWSCPGKDARDLCKGEVPGGCRSCVISDNEYYRGASDFETTQDCVRYRCRCNCDGTYSCPGQTAKRICQTGARIVAPVCKPCRVSATEVFAGNSTFIVNRDCSRFECQCECDGSWECPRDKTTTTCTKDRIDAASSARCKVCRIADKVFPGRTDFKFNRGCFQFDCKCNCSGRWSCDTHNLTNVCRERERAVTERPLVSNARAVRNFATIDVPAPIQIISESSISGNTFMDPDIQGQEEDNSHERIPNTASGSSNPTIPESGSSGNSCQLCHVDGRHFHVGEEFVLLRGCVEYKACRCSCNGRWQCAEITNNCATNQTSGIADVVNKDKTPSSTFWKPLETKSNTESFADTGSHTALKTNIDEDGYLADQRVADESETKRGKQSPKSAIKRYNNGSKKFQSSGTCIGCEIRGVKYTERSTFVLRDGCRQRVCQCHCDGSWSCVESKVDICKVPTKEHTNYPCKNCQVGGDVFISELEFQINSECYQHNCYCYCNGSHNCPADRRRNNCQPNRSELRRESKIVKDTEPRDQTTRPPEENGDGITLSRVFGCKDCLENGQWIQTLASFTKHIGCYQVTCLCQCNGVPSCPTSSFVNICSTPGRKSTQDRTGCRVGERTHFTRVFSHVENCTRRACVCHNDGSWSCRRTANDRQVC